MWVVDGSGWVVDGQWTGGTKWIVGEFVNDIFLTELVNHNK